jgi:hypothetical protein
VSASFEAPEAPRLWVVPIEVVSASEAGFERTFQGASLLAVWPLRLEPGATWEARLSFGIRSLATRVASLESKDSLSALTRTT